MHRPTLPILHALSRSGATLVGKCLASMQGVALLSEIHPHAAGIAGLLRQGRDWLGLLEAGEAERLAGAERFAEAVDLLRRRAEARGQRLVLREWSHLDFYGPPFVAEPAWRSSLVGLLGEGFALRRAVLVRHPVDQLMSLGRLAALGGVLDLPRFLRGHRLLAEMAAETGFVRYEDFTGDPDAVLRRLCGLLDLGFDPGYARRWAAFDKITGDIAPSRGNAVAEIRPLPRPALPPALLPRLLASDDYRRSLELLGYEHPVPVPVAGRAAPG